MNVTLQIKYYQHYVIVYIRIHQTRMHNFQIFPDKSYQKSKQNSFYIRIRIFRGKKLLDLPPSLDFHPTIYLLEEREDRIRVVPSPLHRSQISVQPFEIQEKSGKRVSIPPSEGVLPASSSPPLWYVRLNRFFQTAIPMKYSRNGSPQPFENTERRRGGEESCKTNNFNEHGTSAVQAASSFADGDVIG